MSVQRDNEHGLVELLDEIIGAIDEILEKYQKVLSPEDKADLNSAADMLSDMADDYDPNAEESSEKEEVIIPEIVDAEVVKWHR